MCEITMLTPYGRFKDSVLQTFLTKTIVTVVDFPRVSNLSFGMPQNIPKENAKNSGLSQYPNSKVVFGISI